MFKKVPDPIIDETLKNIRILNTRFPLLGFSCCTNNQQTEKEEKWQTDGNYSVVYRHVYYIYFDINTL